VATAGTTLHVASSAASLARVRYEQYTTPRNASGVLGGGRLSLTSSKVIFHGTTDEDDDGSAHSGQADVTWYNVYVMDCSVKGFASLVLHINGTFELGLVP